MCRLTPGRNRVEKYIPCQICGRPFLDSDPDDVAVHSSPDSALHVYIRLSADQKAEVLGLGSQVRELVGVPGSPLEINEPLGTADEEFGRGQSNRCVGCETVLKGKALVYEAWEEPFSGAVGTFKLCGKCVVPDDSAVKHLSWKAIQRILSYR